MIAMPWHRPPRDHNNERPDNRPTPVVRLDPENPVLLGDLPAVIVSDSIIHDHETLDITRLGPVQAYRLAAAVMGDADFAASWASYVKEQTRRARVLAYLTYLHESGRA